MMYVRTSFQYYVEIILGCLEREFTGETGKIKGTLHLEMKSIFKAFAFSNSSKYSNRREKLGFKPRFGSV